MDLITTELPQKIRKSKAGRKPVQITKTAVMIAAKQIAKQKVEDAISGAMEKILISNLAEAIGTITVLARQEGPTGIAWVQIKEQKRILELIQTKEIGKDYLLMKNHGDWKAGEALMDRLLGKAKPVDDSDDDNKDNLKNVFNQFNTIITDRQVPVLSERTLKKIEARKATNESNE